VRAGKIAVIADIADIAVIGPLTTEDTEEHRACKFLRVPLCSL